MKINKTSFLLFILFILIAFLIVLLILSPKSPSFSCSSVTSVPAWVQNNKIIGVGEGFLNQSYEYLSQNNITFVYDPICPHCENIIKELGSNFQKLQQLNLTKECDILPR